MSALASKSRVRRAAGPWPRLAVGLLIALAACGSAAHAAPDPADARSPGAPRATGPARATAPRRTAPRSAAADSASRAHRMAPRRLDDIRIEGEIPVPQVLFITAREQRRFMEFQHHHYQKTSLELGRATATPSQIVVTAPTPGERKEEQR